MSTPQNRITRTEVGIVAVLCLAVALGLRIFSPGHEGAIGAFQRVGIVMGALWFAVPAGGAEVAWGKVMPFLVSGIVVIALFKRVMIVALPLAIGVGAIAYFLRPRNKSKPGPPYSSRRD